MEIQGSQKSQKNPAKVARITLPEFKTDYKATVTMTVANGTRIQRSMEIYWESRNEASHLQPIEFWRGANTIQWEKKNLFSKQCQGKWIYPCKRMKLNPFLRVEYYPAIRKNEVIPISCHNLWWRRIWERIYIHIYIIESLCRTPEINTN